MPEARLSVHKIKEILRLNAASPSFEAGGWGGFLPRIRTIFISLAAFSDSKKERTSGHFVLARRKPRLLKAFDHGSVFRGHPGAGAALGRSDHRLSPNDIYIDSNLERVTVSWSAKTNTDPNPVNVGAWLYADETINFITAKAIGAHRWSTSGIRQSGYRSGERRACPRATESPSWTKAPEFPSYRRRIFRHPRIPEKPLFSIRVTSAGGMTYSGNSQYCPTRSCP